MQKYDFIKKQYTAYTPPQNGHCDIMVHANEELNCAACGRTINEHNAYIRLRPSRTILALAI